MYNNSFYAQLLHQQQVQQMQEEQQQLQRHQHYQQHAYPPTQHGASSSAADSHHGYGQQEQQSSSYLASMQLQEQQQQALMRAHLERQRLQAQARLGNRQQHAQHARPQQQKQQQQGYDYHRCIEQQQQQERQGQSHSAQRAPKRARQEELYKCDHCDLTPIVRERYTCTICKDFDACQKCATSGKHDPTHPLRKVITIDESNEFPSTSTVLASGAQPASMQVRMASTSGGTASTSFNTNARATNDRGMAETSVTSQIFVTDDEAANFGSKLKHLHADISAILEGNNIGKLPNLLSRNQASVFLDAYQAGLYHLESYVHHTPGNKFNTRTTRWLNQLVVLMAIALARIPLPIAATTAAVLASNESLTSAAFLFIREPKLDECTWEHIVPTLLCATAQMCSADQHRYFQDTAEEADVRRAVQSTWSSKEEELALKTCTRLETVQHGIVGGEMIESSQTVGTLFRTYMSCVRKVFKHALSHPQAVVRSRATAMLEESEQVFRLISAQMGIDARFAEGPLFGASSTTSATSCSSRRAVRNGNFSAGPSIAAAPGENGVNNQSRNKIMKTGYAQAMSSSAATASSSSGEGEGGGLPNKVRAKSSALAMDGNDNDNSSRVGGRRARAKASTASSIDQSLIGPPGADATMTQKQAQRTASALRREIKRARRQLNDLVQLMRNGIRDVSAAVDTVITSTNNDTED